MKYACVVVVSITSIFQYQCIKLIALLCSLEETNPFVISSSWRPCDLKQCWDVFQEYDAYEDDENEVPRSQFGTRRYWDEMYAGMGDFPADEYSWYYGWERSNARRLFQEIVLIPRETARILIPGIGNDPIIRNLHSDGWNNLTAFDYSRKAIEKQREMLLGDDTKVDLHVMDATDLCEDWTKSFDVVLEKGALDAIYLSSTKEQRLRTAIQELRRVLAPNGIFMSISGVIPSETRRAMFPSEEWEWLRDGCDELQAGCFVWRKL